MRVNNTKVTPEMIARLTEYIVGGMSYAEMTQHIYNDIYSIMIEDEEIFWLNLEEQGFDDPEELT